MKAQGTAPPKSGPASPTPAVCLLVCLFSQDPVKNSIHLLHKARLSTQISVSLPISSSSLFACLLNCPLSGLADSWLYLVGFCWDNKYRFQVGDPCDRGKGQVCLKLKNIFILLVKSASRTHVRSNNVDCTRVPR